MFKLTMHEKNSLLYYQGGKAINRIVLSGEERHLWDFYSVEDAYMVINTLLYPGMGNERSRIVEEGKKLSAALLNHMDELLNVYENIISVFYKCSADSLQTGKIMTYRCDRENSLEFLSQGISLSFMSTSLEKEIKQYFQKKAGLVILKIEASAGIEHIDMNQILGNNSGMPEEEEILYPPFLRIKLEKMDLLESEKGYRDVKGNPPVGKYRVRIMGDEIPVLNLEQVAYRIEKIRNLRNEILNFEGVDAAKYVWSCLENGTEPVECGQEKYIAWKAKIQQYVKILSEIAKNRAGFLGNTDWKFRQLENDIKSDFEFANIKREYYEKRLNIIHVMLVIFQALILWVLAINWKDSVLFQARDIAMGLSVLCVVLTGILKCFSWEGKVRQRTSTYLRLDELWRDLKYESDLSDEMIDQYVERYKQIVKDDDAQCEKNLDQTLQHLESQGKDDISNQ